MLCTHKYLHFLPSPVSKELDALVVLRTHPVIVMSAHDPSPSSFPYDVISPALRRPHWQIQIWDTRIYINRASNN
ncbi:hypothetical protein FIBSPDRAFT_304172 [Athelia psychrophila]|uniref:Uncharacterized protein n=1 Tax=Athelia psychrophila TaxID=1759441 RepID=A0A167WX67_9AGAM|nr:hypothetical protein FIBSPDRAFT_317181 [Fibularhizoctonia sp. CBS 109695]KZP06698.1 hypothetical protein FIBSPDRAFT_304172 [Fibularhizoctonia sp. CBS 109695]